MNFSKIEYLASYGTAKQLPPSTLPEVIFSGRSNVGKSSLINRICGRKNLARVSGQPGKTGTINFYGEAPQGKTIDSAAYLVDLPGYGYAKTSFAEKKRWAELVEGYFAQTRNVAVLVQLVDFRHAITQLDRQMLSFCTERGISFLIAATKCDKLNKTERAARTAALAGETAEYPFTACLQVSAQTGEGMDELRSAIDAALENSRRTAEE
ncbi:MAG: ribosome biogenesis GTP-binding protein YihA/YsxC [Oscillospiraceae bacterium]|jgi:GTP-binding protein|nr:ribosome biogenesis GTP-binding protein YihA/YsxC [Oscillospiraceae bacterium]